LKKKANNENKVPATAPLLASEVSAHVELTPPTSNSADVEENVTRVNVVDIQRYLRWADKAINSRRSRSQGRKGAPKKAA
jgi:hypothetical protein